MTAATERAALLRAIAEHLDEHPDLPVVNVIGRWDVWLQIPDRDGQAGVATWARSLGVDSVTAEQPSGADYTRLVLPEAVFAGQPVEVWGTVRPPLEVWHGARVPVFDLEVS